jgi:tRNA-dihydrouridine synthase
MNPENNNATPPTPAIAPGAETIDIGGEGARLGARFDGGGIDPRIPALVPGFDGPFFQAGLAGYSDAAMRLVARRHGCPFCVTEALLDRTLLAGGRGFAKADLGELEDNVPGGADDHPLAGQIMGSDPREMAAAAVKMIEQGRRRSDREYRQLAYVERGVFPSTRPAPSAPRQHLRLPGGVQVGFWEEEVVESGNHGGTNSTEIGPESSHRSLSLGISTTPLRDAEAATFSVLDVNLACPVKKIDKKARGGHWLREPEGAIEILRAVREALPPSIVCSVKLRRSYDDTPEMVACFERVFDAAYALGYAWTTVHARTVEQKYVGPSRWTFLRDLVARHPEKIIFGSGDVWEAADVVRMIAYTGVHAVSVARGCIGNPWIFRQARQLLAGEEPKAPTLEEQRRVLLDHFDLAMKVNESLGLRRSEQYTARTMRKFGIRFAAHHPRRDDVKGEFIRVASLEDWRGVIERWYANGEGRDRAEA